MKRILLSLFFAAAFCCGASAQNSFAKGDVSLGIGLSLLSDMDKNIGFEVSLSGGYHFDEHWEVGLSAGYMRRKGEFFTGTDLNNLKNDENGFTLAPYVTYHWRIAGSLYFDLSGVLACAFNTYERQSLMPWSSDSALIRETVFNVAASPGLTYIVNRHLHVEMRLGGLSWSVAQKRGGSDGHEPPKAQSLALEWNSGINFGVGLRF